jgi:alpha-L-fucosidase
MPGGGAGVGGRAQGGAGAGGGPVVELARNRTSSADSEENNPSANPPKVNLAPSANDGDASTRWCAASGGQHWWQVDLGASHALSRVEIDFEYPAQAAGSAYGYVVGVSPDGATFTDAIDQTGNTSTTMTQSANFPPSTSGRYVRITVTPPTTTPATWSSFWEARVYGH